MAAMSESMTGTGTQPYSPARDLVRRFSKNRAAVGAFVVLVLLGLSAVFAPQLAPHNPNTTNLLLHDHAPMPGHPLGTDQLGRDELSRLLFGGRISLTVGIVATGISTILGVIIGAVAGYFRGWVDNVLMRVVDIVLSIPLLALLIVVAAILPPNFYVTMAIIGAVSWPGTARIVRGEILSLREREFVQAARALGAGGSRIMWKHLVPNTMAPILVSATLSVGNTIILAASLSFLGLGVQQPIPAWGNMLQAATNYRALVLYWWEWIPPGAMITLAALCIFMVGDALRDALDPRLRQ